MNQHTTSQLRRIIFLTMAVLRILSSVASVRPAHAQSTAANFDAVDDYINTKMKELGSFAICTHTVCRQSSLQNVAPFFRTTLSSNEWIVVPTAGERFAK